jgi:hypothetical protein
MFCSYWLFARTPKVLFDFERNIVEGLESEIRRASRLRCGRCGLRGAALGCYYDGCKKSFHVPCAIQITDCRWDFVSFFCLWSNGLYFIHNLRDVLKCFLLHGRINVIFCVLNMFQRHYHVISWVHTQRRMAILLPCVEGLWYFICPPWKDV